MNTGINVGKIQRNKFENGKVRTTYLHEIEAEDIDKIIEKLGLDRNYPIGRKIYYVISTYKGYKKSKMPKEQRERVEKLKIIREDKSAIEETLDLLEILKSEGINISNIKCTKLEGKKQISTYLYEVEADNIEEIIEKYGLDREYPIGRRLQLTTTVYRTGVGAQITPQDIKRIEALGIMQEKNIVKETLEMLEVLRKQGFDVTTMQMTKGDKKESVRLYEIPLLNIEELIENNNWNKNCPIGRRLQSILYKYRDNHLEAEDEKTLEKLGFKKELKSTIQETLEILEILKNEGIDVTKIQRRKKKENGKGRRGTYLYEIEDKNIEEIIKKYNFDPEFPIGMKIDHMIWTYRGKTTGKISEADLKRIKSLGFKKELKSAIQETLEILEILKNEGIDVTKIQQRIIDGKKSRSTYLYEIKDDNIENIIKKYNLDKNYPIGHSIFYLLGSYRGYEKSPSITNEEKERVKKLGLYTEKPSAIEETLSLLEKLDKAGINVANIKMAITINGKTRRRVLHEVEANSIEEIIKELGIDRSYPIGSKIKYLKDKYRKGIYLSPAEKGRIERLGLVSALDKKEAEQNALNKKKEASEKLKNEVYNQLEKKDGSRQGNE